MSVFVSATTHVPGPGGSQYKFSKVSMERVNLQIALLRHTTVFYLEKCGALPYRTQEMTQVPLGLRRAFYLSGATLSLILCSLSVSASGFSIHGLLVQWRLTRAP